MRKYSRILGTGSCLPEKTLTNADLEKIVETSDKWITERTGIKSRHMLAAGEKGIGMAEVAARNALDASGINKNDIDLIIVATTTPDTLFPNMATQLQRRLGMQTTLCPAFDLSAACTGFIYALNVADKYIRSEEAKNVLVVSCESLTRVTDFTDRSTCVLFGDGAGAVVLGSSDEPGIYDTVLHSDGSYTDLLYLDGELYDQEKCSPCYIKMSGNEVFKVAVTKLGEIVEEVLAKNAFPTEKLDWLIPHQANLRIIQATARKLAIPMEKVIQTIQDQGNTSAASIPLALDIGVRDGRIKRGDNILLEAFGAGFTWGAALVKF